MSTHLYCLLPGEAPTSVPSGLTGVEGGSVRALPVDHLVAWVSDVERDIPVSIDGVRAHDAVVEAAFETGSTPVPARFGQRFANDDACAAALNSRGPSSNHCSRRCRARRDDDHHHAVDAPDDSRLEPVIPEMFEPAVRNGAVSRDVAVEAATGAGACDGRSAQRSPGDPQRRPAVADPPDGDADTAADHRAPCRARRWRVQARGRDDRTGPEFQARSSVRGLRIASVRFDRTAAGCTA
jgi:hypothetical protein